MSANNTFSSAQSGNATAAAQSVAPLTINPAPGRSLAEPYGDALGGHLNVNRPNAMDAYKYAQNIGPEAYRNEELIIYQQTLEDAIAREESWVTTDQWFPLTYTNGRNFVAEMMTWERTIQQRYPNLGVPPRIRHSMREVRATIEQYAEAFEIEEEFLSTAKGRTIFSGNIIAIARNMMNTINFIVFHEMLTAHTNQQRWQMMFGNEQDHIDIDALIAREVAMFAAAQKSEKGLAALVDAAVGLLVDYGAGRPTGIAMPSELLTYINRWEKDRTEYYLAGPNGPVRAESDGRFEVTRYRDISVFQTKNLVTNNQGDSSLQVLRRPRMVGEFYIDNASHLVEDILSPPQGGYTFFTRHRDFAIYNETRGAYQKISFEKAVKYCGVFDTQSGARHQAMEGENGHFFKRKNTLGELDARYFDPKVAAASFKTYVQRNPVVVAATAGQPGKEEVTGGPLSGYDDPIQAILEQNRVNRSPNGFKILGSTDSKSPNVLSLPRYFSGAEETLGLDTYDGQLSIVKYGKHAGYPSYLISQAEERVRDVHRALSSERLDLSARLSESQRSLVACRALYRRMRRDSTHAPSAFLVDRSKIRRSSSSSVRSIDASALFDASVTVSKSVASELASSSSSSSSVLRVNLGAGLGAVQVSGFAQLPRVVQLQLAMGELSAPMFRELVAEAANDDRLSQLVGALCVCADACSKKSGDSSPSRVVRKLVAAFRAQQLDLSSWMDGSGQELTDEGIAQMNTLLRSKAGDYKPSEDTPLLSAQEADLIVKSLSRQSTLGDHQLQLQRDITAPMPFNTSDASGYFESAKQDVAPSVSRAAHALEHSIAESSSSSSSLPSFDSGAFISAPSLAYTNAVHEKQRSLPIESRTMLPCNLHDFQTPVLDAAAIEEMYANKVFGGASAARSEHLALFEGHDTKRVQFQLDNVPPKSVVRTGVIDVSEPKVGVDADWEALIKRGGYAGPIVKETLNGYLNLSIATFDDIQTDFLSANVLFPFTMVLVRPFIEHLMSSALVVRGGADTGQTLISASRVLVSADNLHGNRVWSLRYYAGAITIDPRKIVLLTDVFSHRYSGGRNCELVDPGRNVNEARISLQAARESGINRPSVISLLLPSMMRSVPRLFSISGSYPLSAAQSQIVTDGGKVYIGQEYYAKDLYQLFGDISSRADEDSRTYFDSAAAYADNVTALQGAQQLFDPKTNSHSMHISSQSHLNDALSYDHSSKDVLNGGSGPVPTLMMWNNLPILPADE